MQINQGNLHNLFKTFNVLYNEALQGATPMYGDIALQTTSTGNSEEYHWLGAVPGMKKFLGDTVLRNLSAHGYTIKNEEWDDTVVIPRKDIENDKYGVYSPLFSALGLAAAQHPDELVANLLLAGFTTLCYTGKNFFDSNHEPEKGKLKFTNKMTAKLSAAGYRQARANLIGRRNAEGRSMGLGRKLKLVVSPENEATARQILIADMAIQAGSGASAASVASVTNVDKGTAELMVWPYLAGQNAWFLLEVGMPVRPVIFQTNLKPVLTPVTDPQSDTVALKKKFLFQAYGRYNAGFGLPEFAIGSDGSTDAL